MVEESSPLLPPAEESIEAETDTELEPEPESGEPAPGPISEPDFVCDCKKWMRSACKGLPFFKEHESRRYCVLHYPGKEKSADFKTALDAKLNKRDFDFRGVWFADKADFMRFEFSAAVDFRSATFSADADFSDVTFSAPVSFSSATFSASAGFAETVFSANADFKSATFRASAYFFSAIFGAEASFDGATFCKGVSFREALFSAHTSLSSATFAAGVSFGKATFRGHTHFISTKFNGDVDFNRTTFSAYVHFSGAAFSAVAAFNGSVFCAAAYFSGASFFDSVRFFGRAREKELKASVNAPTMPFGNDRSLHFDHVRIEHPNRVSFHTLSLRPHWFVNVDSRQFAFTDVDWQWDRISIKHEIAALEANKVSAPNRLLAIACRQLAENAGANNRYEEASNFRYWAMDLARRTKWKRWSFWKTDWLYMLYWAVSGYGERILRGLGVLAVVWIVFVLLYMQAGFEQKPPKSSNEVALSMAVPSMTIEDKTGQPLEFSRSLTYSLAVMSLQKPEPRPLTNWAHTLVTLEAILGPVQAALLALAIRRKFMR